MVIMEKGQKYEIYDPKTNLVSVMKIETVCRDDEGNLDGVCETTIEQYELEHKEIGFGTKEQRKGGDTPQ